MWYHDGEPIEIKRNGKINTRVIKGGVEMQVPTKELEERPDPPAILEETPPTIASPVVAVERIDIPIEIDEPAEETSQLEEEDVPPITVKFKTAAEIEASVPISVGPRSVAKLVTAAKALGNSISEKATPSSPRRGLAGHLPKENQSHSTIRRTSRSGRRPKVSGS